MHSKRTQKQLAKFLSGTDTPLLVSEWFSLFPKDIRKALYPRILNWRTPTERMTRNFYNALLFAFVWDDTPEGYSFWHSIQQTLAHIARMPPELRYSEFKALCLRLQTKLRK